MKTQSVVVDVGNSALHFGSFAADNAADNAPKPTRVLNVPCEGNDLATIAPWLDQGGIEKPVHWRIGSVNPRAHDPLLKWIEGRDETYRLISFADLPIDVAVKRPQAVGIDRLAAAAAANKHRNPLNPAIIVDAGTAITIDCVSARGVFLGGSIAPGLQLSMQSLNQNTAQLPLIHIHSPPGLIGDCTGPAIKSGVYWMTVGGIERLIDRLEHELASPCSIFVTGGAMPALLPNLRHNVDHHPNLVLSGLALAHHE